MPKRPAGDQDATSVPDWTTLDGSHETIRELRLKLEEATAHRDMIVRELRAGGVTIYAIAKRLGMTQGAVRNMLGLR